ncbi:MAG TPA: hypothetical protein VE781_15165 [Kineosporiaceae bacterium]|jgi:hypothetical protein|nr:hypothetical protein [Kineosporiaceae bacterium]
MTPHDATVAAETTPTVPVPAGRPPGFLAPPGLAPVVDLLPAARTPSSAWFDAVSGATGGSGAIAAHGPCLAVAAGPAGQILVGDPADDRGPRSLVGRHGAPVTALVSSGHLLFSAGCDGRVLGWAPATSGLSVVVACHATGVTATAFAADGRLLTAGHDGRVLAWVDATPERAAEHPGGVEALAALPGGALVTAGRDGRLLLHRPGAGEPPVELLQRRREITVALAGGSDGLLTAGGHRGVVRWWPELADTGRPEEVGVHGGWVLALVALAGDRLAAVGGATVTVWDLRSGAASRVDLDPGLHATSAAVLPTGELAVAAPDGRVQLVPVPALAG